MPLGSMLPLLLAGALSLSPSARDTDAAVAECVALLLERPSLAERIQQGGIVGYVIIGIGILALLIALERFVVLNIAGTKVNAQLKSKQANANNPLGRVLKVYEDNRSVDVETLELKLGEAILKETPKLNRGLLFLKIIAVVAPLDPCAYVQGGPLPMPRTMSLPRPASNGRPSMTPLPASMTT